MESSEKILTTIFNKTSKYKLIVKKWESDFKKVHGNNPNRNDIKNAPSDIKAAYKKYWMLKTNELEKSFMDSTFDDCSLNDDFTTDDLRVKEQTTSPETDHSQERTHNLENDCFVHPGDTRISTQLHENKEKSPVISHSATEGNTESNIIDNCLRKADPLKESNLDNVHCSKFLEMPEQHSKSEDSSGKFSLLKELDSSNMDCPKEQVKCNPGNSTTDKNDLEKLNDKGWGSHLNKTMEAAKKSKSLTKSVSSHFLEKLFVGSKFKKKNPRKIKSFSRLNSLKKEELSGKEPASSNHEDGFPVLKKDLNKQSGAEKVMADGESESMTRDLDDLVKDLVPFNSVISNVSIKKSNPTLSNVPKPLIGETVPSNLTCSRKLDKGWLERCNVRSSIDLMKQNSFDSGIDVSDSNVNTSTQNSSASTFEASPFSPDNFVFSRNTSSLNTDNNPCDKNNFSSENKVGISHDDPSIDDDDSSDEDLVFDSDSEGERSRSNFRFSNSSFKNKSVSKPNPTEATENHVENISSCEISRSSNFVHDFSLKAETSTELSKDTGILGAESRKRQCTNDDSFMECRLFKRLKETDSTSSPNISPIANVPLKNQKIKESPISHIDKRKEEILKKKLASGKANENFVRINIQKKVFVRGKKTMTNSKYKKQQWKAKKKLQNYQTGRSFTSDGDFQTCFKCNEIGHWAKDCCKGQILLPKEEGDDELDCPFPTLEEAEEIANEMKESAHLRKNQMNRDKVQTVQTAYELENTVAPPPEELVDKFSHVEPYFGTNEDGSLIDTPLEVLDALLEFDHKQFRPGQEEAVMRILSGKSTLVTLCTGAGKSLIYQLPAFMYARRSNCITLVVSPLISLMEDQILRIPSFCNAACLHTNQNEAQKNKILDRLKNGEINVLLVSPEAVVASDRMANNGFLRFLPPIAFACIDEAHCVSMWSHNFRPSYLMICRVLRERMGVKTILGLTASATGPTIESIVTHLGINDGLSGVIRDIPLPDNLILSVSRDENRDSALLKLLQGPRFSSFDCIVVYCTRREECERLAAFLRTTLRDIPKPAHIKKSSLSWTAEAYHAGLSSGRRKQVQNGFMKGNVRIVVATVAFGMGINKSNIRGIIHYNMPARCENYVQEVGRAGRDGLPAHCHLFLSSEGQDLNELRRHIYANSIARHTLRRLLEKVFVPCKCPAELSANNSGQSIRSCKRHERAIDIDEIVAQLDVPSENIMTLLCYLEAHPKKWIDILPQSYTMCKVSVYGGEMQLRKACKTCPPLAVAVAEERKKKNSNLRSFEFPVVSLAASIGWDSGIVKRSLSNVMWTEVNGKSKKSGINIEFTNLGFRVLAPGNLPPNELDEALDSLHKQVEFHEQTSLKQLQFLFNCLTEVCFKSSEDCLEEVDMEKSEILKKNIRAYFADDSATTHSIEKIVATGLNNQAQVLGDIRSLVETHRDSMFTGLAIARIFHGISSPNYPAIVWGRTRFWRAHLLEDFKSLVQIATIELIKFR